MFVIQAAMGIGKTTVIAREIAQANGLREYYAPTHGLANEVKEKILQLNPSLRVVVIAGRSHPGADGNPLCRKHKLAEGVARAGGDVYGSICSKKRVVAKTTAFERCQYYTACPYIAQFRPADVTIYPHAYLPLRRMKLEPAVPDIAVIDESFYSSCIEVVDVPIRLLRAPFLDQSTAHVLAQVEHALVRELPLLTYLRETGAYAEEWVAAWKSISTGAHISPAMGASEQKRALPQLRERSLLKALFHIVFVEMGHGRRGSQGILYSAESQMVKVHITKRIVRFDERTYGPPGKVARLIHIDGSADDRIIQQWFPGARTTRISAPRNARVVQVSSTRCSTTSLSPRRNSDASSKKVARRRLRQLEAFIARKAVQHPKVLVVGPQEITGNPKTKVRPLIRVPANADLAHFNAIRGIDRWKDHDAIILIGRNEPPIEVAEEIARCVFLTDYEPLKFAEEWTTEPRGYRLKKGRQGVSVITHPDSRIQAILEQLREAESVQAIDRLRLIHSTTTKAVYILSNIPLDIDVDELVTWDELMEGARLEQAWNALPDVMPLQPDWLARRFPRLWKTPDAAKADVRRWLKECQITNNIHISNLTLFKHQYRTARSLSGGSRQRAWSVFLSRETDAEQTRACLEGLLGFPVELRPVSRGDLPTAAGDQASAPPAAITSSSSSVIASSRAILTRASPESTTRLVPCA